MDSKQESRTVLVVEDQEEISSQMKSMLQGKGHRVFQAANAETAIEIAEKDRPKLILTDLDLPTFDQLVQLVRAHNDLKNVPVAIIDINDPKVDRRNGVKILADFDQLDELLDSDDQD